MRITYIHDRPDWPRFRWNIDELHQELGRVRHKQGLLLGRMRSLGFGLQEEATLEVLTEDIQKTSEIEGERLDREQVRSSLARRLGLDTGALAPADRSVEGIVEVMLDATQRYRDPLTSERLFRWHGAMFPTGYSGVHRIQVGAWRDDASGPMRVVSGRGGRERIHFEAPLAPRIPTEIAGFLQWLESQEPGDPVLKAAITHLWFVTIHPFEDGNGRIARAISDMVLARSEDSPCRFYSVSAQIRKERNAYYEMLEATQRGGLDITSWMKWFVACLESAIEGAGGVLDAVLRKSRFWEEQAGASLNERQRLILNKLFDGFEGKLTTTKWAKIAKCSQDTALRDIQDLIAKGVLIQDEAKGRSTSYSLRPD